MSPVSPSDPPHPPDGAPSPSTEINLPKPNPVNSTPDPCSSQADLSIHGPWSTDEAAMLPLHPLWFALLRQIVAVKMAAEMESLMSLGERRRQRRWRAWRSAPRCCGSRCRRASMSPTPLCVVSILGSFDSRLTALDSAMRPIQVRMHVRTAHENIDRTLRSADRMSSSPSSTGLERPRVKYRRGRMRTFKAS